MAAPKIVSVSPANGVDDVLAGTPVVVTFDQLIDPATFTDETFLLSGPGQDSIITPIQQIGTQPASETGREYITGSFDFSELGGVTKVTFRPGRPLRPRVQYDLYIAGGNPIAGATVVRNPAGEPMAEAYTWSFTTTGESVVSPPAPPVPLEYRPRLEADQVRVIPMKSIGNDLRIIQLIFPDEIDQDSFDRNDVQVSISALINDPDVVVPPDLQVMVEVDKNIMTITITGWPPDVE